MRNFYDTQIGALEASIAPAKKSQNLTPTLHNEPETDGNLYYVKYNLLGSGRVQIGSTNKETPILPFQPTTPNQRLIVQLHKFLQKHLSQLDTKLFNIGSEKAVSVKFTDGNEVTTLLIQSKPYNAVSYVHITKLSTDNLGMQITASFVAHTPEMIVAKLMDHGDFVCPQFAACITYCPTCPEL